MSPHHGKYPARIHAHFQGGGQPLTTSCIRDMFGIELEQAHRIVRQMKAAACWSVDVRKDGKDYRGLPRQVIYGVTQITKTKD